MKRSSSAGYLGGRRWHSAWLSIYQQQQHGINIMAVSQQRWHQWRSA